MLQKTNIAVLLGGAILCPGFRAGFEIGQAGKADVVVHPGEAFAGGKATTHWAENRGSVAAVWIAVDIAKGPLSRFG